jgi:uncharacterized damage-inducible protein DinB
MGKLLQAALVDQTSRTATGDPWYGSSIEEVLRDVTFSQAAARPIPAAHTIWELVLHLAAWTREVERRFRQGDWRLPEDGDWPAMPAPTAEAWAHDSARLLAEHETLRQTLSAAPVERLEELVGTERDQHLGTGVPFYLMVLGQLQHDTYHLGQISLLKKALGR